MDGYGKHINEYLEYDDLNRKMKTKMMENIGNQPKTIEEVIEDTSPDEVMVMNIVEDIEAKKESVDTINQFNINKDESCEVMKVNMAAPTPVKIISRKNQQFAKSVDMEEGTKKNVLCNTQIQSGVKMKLAY